MSLDTGRPHWLSDSTISPLESAQPRAADIPRIASLPGRPAEREGSMADQGSTKAAARRTRRQLLTGDTGALAAVLPAPAGPRGAGPTAAATGGPRRGRTARAVRGP